jgi:hypothetical protein
MESASSEGIEPSFTDVFKKSIMARARRFFVNSEEAYVMVRRSHFGKLFKVMRGCKFSKKSYHFIRYNRGTEGYEEI